MNDIKIYILIDDKDEKTNDEIRTHGAHFSVTEEKQTPEEIKRLGYFLVDRSISTLQKKGIIKNRS